MAEAVETYGAGTFVVSEANGHLSRAAVTVVTGQNLQAGTVLGIITATGKYKILNPGGADGSQTAAGILLSDVNATAADVKGTAYVRLMEVTGAELVWPGGITGPQQTTAIGQLAALNIVVR